MSKKKMFMSVTATAAIASAIFAAEEVEAATHKVQSGDSLWSIAQKYGTSVSTLKAVNNLTSDIIYPNQIIETSNTAGSNSSGSNKVEKPSSNSSAGNTSNSSTGSNTYTVKAGDTLSGIASRHNISLQNLMKWNNLDTTLIFPGNVFVVSEPGKESSSGSTGNSNSSSNNSSSGAPSSSQQTGSSSVYTVKSGDTLSRIASQHKVTVANLKRWNNLKSDLILIGQKLNIGEGSSSSGGSSKPAAPPKVDVSYNIDNLLNVANSQLGVPYVWAGATPSGFDCSGFIYYAYKNAGMDISRTSSAGYFDRSYYVNQPQVGDLVFFAGTYKAGISHMGIYIGDNKFIHAGSSTGVTVASLDSSYWSKHFDSFKRFY
ncbi:C40 family peptidase [Oceanobacillus sp. CAU 1775]